MGNSEPDAVITLRVDNFFSLRDKVVSPPTMAWGFSWKLEIEPTYETNGAPKSVNWHLHCDGSKSSWSCLASVDLEYQNYASDIDRLELGSFHAGKPSRGYSSSVSWSDLCDPHKGYIKDNAVTFKAKVFVHNKWALKEEEQSDQTSRFDPAPFLCDRDRMQRFSDFTIKTEVIAIKCHKLMLASRSEVFEMMLSHDCIETRINEVLIKDFRDDTVKAFVKFVYHGRLAEEDYTAELLAMAHKYQVVDLKSACALYLATHVTKDNVAEVWEAAETFEMPELLKPVHAFFQDESNWNEDMPELENVIKKHPNYFIKLYKDTVSGRYDDDYDYEAEYY